MPEDFCGTGDWDDVPLVDRKAYDWLKQEDADKKTKKGKRPKATSSEADDNKRQCLMSGFMPKRLDASKKEAYDLAVHKFVVEDGRPFETAELVFRTYVPFSLTAPTNQPTPLLCYGLRGIYGRFDSKLNLTADSIRTQKIRFAGP